MRLSDICEINPKAQTLADDVMVSFVAMTDVSEDGGINTSIVRPFYEVKKGFTFFIEGDVLLAKITPCMENGKGALATGLSNGFGLGSTEFHVLRPYSDRVLGKWLYYFTIWPSFRRDAEQNMTGSAGQKRVPKSFLEKYELSVPSIKTQNEQAEVLDQIKRIIKHRSQQLSALDDLIKARFVEMFGDAVINPYGYEQVTIGDACTLINGRAFKPSDWGEEGLPIVRIQNLNDANAPFNYYDGEVSEQHLIDSGMLLFSWSGTPGTSFGAFMWNRGPGALNQHIFKVIPKLDFDLDYLRYAMNGQLSTIIAKAHGGVGLQHITKAELEKIFLLHPNIREQKQFAAFISQIDKSKSVIQKSLAETQLLFDSLMQQYFG